MTSTELKLLSKEFRKTLGDRKDEWWATDQEVWDDMGKRFVRWYNDYGKKWLENHRKCKR